MIFPSTKFSLLICLLVISSSLFAQQPSWRSFDNSRLNNLKQQERQIYPTAFNAQAINFKELTAFLEEGLSSKSDQLIFEIPMPDGQIQAFEIELSSVFSEGLSSKYPTIHTYKGRSMDESKSTIHMGLSPKGFHAMILSEKGSYFVDKYLPSNNNYYQSYYRKDYTNQQAFKCLVEDTKTEVQESIESQGLFAGDCTLRKYRLALACTGEYSNFHGGTVESVLAEFAIAMTRVNGIYERDNGITMELIENTDEVIYLNGGTDPYTNNSGGTMLGENQATLDDVIGSENYDIGHVFSTGGGGIASLQSPCGNGKARGVTGLGSPINDPFYVDYVSHEMGHQFGANHTQNNSCNRNNSTAMEPGSANTIMGYAGICAPNTANNSDDHFHAVSIQEIANFIVNGNGATCAENINTNNNAPEITLTQTEYNLPIGTSFILQAEADDLDDDALTFCWEQMDNEVATMPPLNTNDSGPAFISRPPVSDNYRYFPNIDAIVNNQIPTWEVVPFVARDMSFICTVRDNFDGHGCTDEVSVELEFFDEAGPFLVMVPNTNLTWNATEIEEISWDVSGTDMAPVSCSMVDVLLSIDGGYTYPILVEENVMNDGVHEIVVPAVSTDMARIMIKCSDNIFFDISDENFTIKTPFSVSLDKYSSDFCGIATDTFELNTEAFDGFDEAISIEFMNVPAGLDVNVSDSPITPPNTASIYVENTGAAVGTYHIIIQAITSTITIEQEITINIISSSLSTPTNLLPENGTINVGSSVELSWDEVVFADNYSIIISTSPDFTVDPITIEVNGSTLFTEISDLEEGTVYYWKLQAKNQCSDSEESMISAFQTAISSCEIIAAKDLQIEIPSNSVGVITNDLNVSGISSFSYMKIFFDMDHTWLGDVKATVTSPLGTPAVLFDQIGVPASEFGCDQDDMILDFFDSSLNSAAELEASCGNFMSDYQSVDPLSIFDGENVNGTWTIEVEDFFDEDGGELDEWSLQFCTDGVVSDGILVHNPLIVAMGQSKLVANYNLEIQNSADDVSTFAVLSMPMHGVLELDLDDDGIFDPAGIGSTFTESDINSGLFRYNHGGGTEMTDMFLYDAIDEKSAWSHNEIFEIIISDGSLAVVAVIGEDILCNGGHNGVIIAEPIGGEAPYQFSIDGENFQDEAIFNELTAGSYTVTVKDALGQEIQSNEIILTEPDPIIAESILDFYNIEVMAEGGTPNYMFSLDGENYQESNVFVKPGNGSYTIFVKDNNECIQTAFINVDIAELQLGLTSVNDILCFGDETGIIEAQGIGGFEPYEFSLDGTNYSENGSFQNLPAGMYTIYIKDAGGLIETSEITIVAPVEITLTGSFSNNQLNLDGQGGTGNLEFSLDGTNYEVSNQFENYGEDPFTAYVIDENNCIVMINLIPLFAELEFDEIECFGLDNGRIELITQGGSGDGYEYSLNNLDFQSSNVFENLGAGNYTVYVRDNANNTYTTTEIVLIEPVQLEASAMLDGSDVLVVNATGGTGTIFFSFDGGSTFKDVNTFDWMGEDEILILIKDSNGCEIELLWTYLDINESVIETGLKIYPNPVRNRLQVELIDLKGQDKIDLALINNLGQTVMIKSLNTIGSTSINIDHLPEGLYHILIKSEEQYFSKKIIIVD